MTARAYYNENDPYAAQWIKNLIVAGEIPNGDVDIRSICDVQPSEVSDYIQCHFFAGIAGWSYALRLAGWPEDRPVWTGSCPCQPFSGIGKRKGEQDERHLWPDFARLIRVCKPPAIFGEQVASKDGRKWLAGVFADLEAMGHRVAGADLCAAGIGAPHIRQRLYWVGHAIGAGLERHDWNGAIGRRKETPRSDPATGSSGVEPSGLDAVSLLRRSDMHDSWGAYGGLRLSTDRRVDQRSLQPWEQHDALPCSDGWRRVRPGSFPLAHGIPDRVGKLRAYGNAIVPQVGAAFIQAYAESVGIELEQPHKYEWSR